MQCKALFIQTQQQWQISMFTQSSAGVEQANDSTLVIGKRQIFPVEEHESGIEFGWTQWHKKQGSQPRC